MRIHLLRLGLISALILSSSLSFAQKSPEDEARKYYLRGVAAIEMAKSDEEMINAIEEFGKATKIAPGMAAAWYNLGMVQAKIGRLRDAMDSFNHYVALAPRSEDAKKVRDELVKLEYRLEQAEKYNHLAGVWVQPDGELAQVRTEGGKLTIHIKQMLFPGIVERWMWGEQTVQGEYLRDLTLRLETRGTRLAGSIEIPIYAPTASSSGSHQWCSFPPGKETNQVEGVLDKGQMVLRIKKIKYKFEHNRGENMLFGSTIVRCDGVTPLGEIIVETALRGPLPPPGKGGLGIIFSYGRYVYKIAENAVGGLRLGDEIISVDGVNLAELPSEYERLLKIRGEPGSTANLVVKRVIEKAGAFSDEKAEILNMSVQRIELP